LSYQSNSDGPWRYVAPFSIFKRLLAGRDADPGAPKPKEITMKFFGTVKSFDLASGDGSIKPDTAGDDLRFDRNAIMWGGETPPITGQRLSYDIGQTKERQTCAVNLQTI
jgi:cold shock CspA family protein